MQICRRISIGIIKKVGSDAFAAIMCLEVLSKTSSPQRFQLLLSLRNPGYRRRNGVKSKAWASQSAKMHVRTMFVKVVAGQQYCITLKNSAIRQTNGHVFTGFGRDVETTLQAEQLVEISSRAATSYLHSGMPCHSG